MNNRIPIPLRAIIARNIRRCRFQKFGGRGGSKLCAEAFGVTLQQWSPWERGRRTPSESRLAKMAEFFGVTVEWMCRENGPLPGPQGLPSPSPDFGEGAPPQGIGQNLSNIGAFGGNAGEDIPSSQSHPAPPGSPASFFWLAHHLVMSIEKHGLRLDKQSLEYLAHCIKQL